MHVSNYIFQILKSKPTILMSWGFYKPKRVENGLTFHVNGLIHVGYVTVNYNEGKDLFQVILTDANNAETKRIEDVYVDQLIDVIDEAVEHTTDYATRIRNRYNFN